MKLKAIILVVLFGFGLCKMIIRQEKDHTLRHDYIRHNIRNTSLNHHTVQISVNQKNIAKLKDTLNEVSNIVSKEYGKYLSYEEIGELIRNPESLSLVKLWLHSNNIDIIHETEYGEYLTIQASIEKLEQLFQTTFHEYAINKKLQNEHDSTSVIYRASSYSLPEELSPHIDGVLNIVSLPLYTMNTKQRDLASDKTTINKKSSINRRNIKLDNYIPEIDKSSSFIGLKTPLTIQSMYGIINNRFNGQDYDLPGNGSQSLYGRGTEAYISSDIVAFQRFFDLPQLVNASSQIGGSFPNNSKCYSTNIDSCIPASAGLEYLTSISGDVPTSYYNDVSTTNDFVSWIVSISMSVNPPLVNVVGSFTYETFLTVDELNAFETEAIKLSLRGVTIISAAGDDGVGGYLFQEGYPLSLCGYYAMFPASSPYVTSIGGTSGGHIPESPEISASAATGQNITSGGGFSSYYLVPSFQVDVVNSYFSSLTTQPNQECTNPFQTQFRGYPDLSLAATDLVFMVNDQLYSYSSTFFSVSIFGGMVSLVNNHRLQNSLPSLGWINPAIYSGYKYFALDITVGNNNCTALATHCCNIGFDAAVGWDPVSGFGSIDFQSFFKHFSVRRLLTDTPSSIPTLSPSTFPTNQTSDILESFPSLMPTCIPITFSTDYPTADSTFEPTQIPSNFPTEFPTCDPTCHPSYLSTFKPTRNPSVNPSFQPTVTPSNIPAINPTFSPTKFVKPTFNPTFIPSLALPTNLPSSDKPQNPTVGPSSFPSSLNPSYEVTQPPTLLPKTISTPVPSVSATILPTYLLTVKPSATLTVSPSAIPSTAPTSIQSQSPTYYPSYFPTSSTPSIIPSTIPSSLVTQPPTSVYSTISPSTLPTRLPSFVRSTKPTAIPTSVRPTSSPSNKSSFSPSSLPSFYPSSTSSFTPSRADIKLRCDPYNLDHTNNAISNYATCSIPNVCPGTTLQVSDCSSSCKGDQFIRLHDSQGIEVMFNDDGKCEEPLQLCSSISYSFNGESCQNFTLQEGCYDDESCSGKFKVVYDSLPSTMTESFQFPSAYPTPAPTFIPTIIPSQLSTLSPSLSPTVAKESNGQFYCNTYLAADTDDATINYDVCEIPNVCPGVVLTISDCGESCQGDTFIRLYSPLGTMLMYDDDGCSHDPYASCSKLTYVYTEPECSSLFLHQGCYDSGVCAGQMTVAYTYTLSPTSKSSYFQ